MTDHLSERTRWAKAFACAGIVLALAAFMIDRWRTLLDGREVVAQVLPTTFYWPLFRVALMLMAARPFIRLPS
jgi:hypothetical protein